MENILPLSAYLRQSRFLPNIFLSAGAILGFLFGLARYFASGDSWPRRQIRASLLEGMWGGVGIGLLLWIVISILVAVLTVRAYRATYRGLAAPPPEGERFSHRLPVSLEQESFPLRRVGGVLYARAGKLVFAPQTAIPDGGGRSFRPVPLAADTRMRTGFRDPLPRRRPWLGTPPLEILEIGPPGEALVFQVPEAEKAARRLREIVLGFG